MLTAGRLACAVSKNTLGLAKAASKCSNRKRETPDKIDCRNSERNAVIYIQSATCFWQEKGACPTCTFDLERKQKERVQPAPCVGKKAKVTCQLAPWFWQLPFGSSVTLSAPLPVAIWLLGFFGYSLTPLPVVIVWFSVGPRSKVPK